MENILLNLLRAKIYWGKSCKFVIDESQKQKYCLHRYWYNWTSHLRSTLVKYQIFFPIIQPSRYCLHAEWAHNTGVAEPDKETPSEQSSNQLMLPDDHIWPWLIHGSCTECYSNSYVPSGPPAWLPSVFKPCSLLMSVFASTSTSPSKFNIASVVAQTRTQRLGLNSFSAFLFPLLMTQC